MGSAEGRLPFGRARRSRRARSFRCKEDIAEFAHLLRLVEEMLTEYWRNIFLPDSFEANMTKVVAHQIRVADHALRVEKLKELLIQSDQSVGRVIGHVAEAVVGEPCLQYHGIRVELHVP